MSVKKVIIPAAGLGTRLLPATKAQPKEMMPVVDRPVIQYVVEEAIASKIEDVLVITGRGKRALEDHFDRSVELEKYLSFKKDFENLAAIAELSEGPPTFFIRQKEPKGLGHAVLCGAKHVDDQPFAVMLGDDICVSSQPALAQLISFYEKNPGIILGIQEVPPDMVDLYGIATVSEMEGEDRGFIVDDIVEKPDIDKSPSNLAVMGRYILVPEVFDALKNIEPDKRGELQLTDAIHHLIGKVPVYGYIFEGERYDVGNKLSYLIANIELALLRDDLKDGVSQYLVDLRTRLESQQVGAG